MSFLKATHHKSNSLSQSTAPSPAASHASFSSQRPMKRQRELPAHISSDTSGRSLLNHITFAVDYLKEKEVAIPFSAILSFLSLSPTDSLKEVLAVQQVLRKHANVDYLPEAAPSPSASGSQPTSRSDWNKGMYRFRPKYNIRSSSDLMSFLQSQRNFTGIPVKDLREGWSGATKAVNDLEKERKILVTRNKKDGSARQVWLGDATLYQPIEPEFKVMWSKIKIPPEIDLPRMLQKDGHKSTSADGSSKIDPKAMAAPKKVQKKPRRGGKTTNTHMLGLLKDYSHRRA